MSIKRMALAAALTVALMAPSALMPARAGAMAGGASEPTQIMNNIQLVLSYVKQAKTVQNTLQSARYLKQSLKQLDPSTLSRLTGQPIDQVRKLVEMDDQLRQIMRSGDASVDVLRRALKDVQTLGITPKEYVERRAKLAEVQGGAYAKSYENDTKQLRALNSQMQHLQATAASIPSVSSQIDGLQQLLAQGTQTQAQLVSLNAAITKANALASRRNEAAYYDSKASKAFAKDDAKKLNNVKVSMPDPMKIDVTSNKQGGAGR